MEQRKKVGLALGAGGGRGLAHIGALQVLEEEHIPIDLCAGCSIGALVGAIYCAGTDLKLLGRYADTLLPKNILDLSFAPTSGGLLAGDKVEEMVRTLTHGLEFGQTRIPYWCTAVDLETGEQRVFNEGPLCRGARASMAIPGVFTPAYIDGRYYIDGGIQEEIPVACLKAQGADVVIAIDLSIKKYSMGDGKITVTGTLSRAFEIMQETVTRLRAQPIDVRIRPDASFMGMVSTKGAAECVAEGRRAATEALPQLKKALGLSDNIKED